jgi:hypothetical protein
MRDIVNYKPKAFTTLAPILQEWARLNNDLGAKWASKEADAPWWYNERASLSLLAGAIWRVEGWAFEEFSTAKALALPQTARSHGPGRCDLMFGIRGRTFVAEAKQAWPNLGGSIPQAIATTHAALAAACKDALRVPDWGYPRLGIVIAAPMLRASKASQLDALVSRYVVGLSVDRAVSIAYAFPAAAMDLRPSSAYKDFVFPGVVLLVRSAKKL